MELKMGFNCEFCGKECQSITSLKMHLLSHINPSKPNNQENLKGGTNMNEGISQREFDNLCKELDKVKGNLEDHQHEKYTTKEDLQQLEQKLLNLIEEKAKKEPEQKQEAEEDELDLFE